MCVYYCMEKLNRVDRFENVFILLICMGIIERKKNLGSAAKNRDGWMIVNKHTFLPYTFWFASFISFGLVRPRKSIVVTCVSGSLPKTIKIGRSTQLFYFIFWVCAKNLRSVGEPETLFSWPYLQECRLSLHNARPTLKNFCFLIPDIIKKRRVSGICYFWKREK